MSGFFWTLLGAAALVSVLVLFALPFGPDLIYAAGQGSLLGAVFMLGWKERHRLSVPQPDHPAWRNRDL